jgi:hypothetical protein
MALKQVKAYTLTAEILAAEVEKIRSGDLGLPENEVAASLETVRSIADRFAESFEYDNPHFDLPRFLRDAGVENI